MWKKSIVAFCVGTKHKSRGQTLVEYVLILGVVVGMILFIARPFLVKFFGNMRDGFQNASVFKSDGSGFYYFPVK